MGHVILAWGTSLMAVLIVMLVLYGIFSKKGDEQSHIWNAALVIFFPFCARQPDQPVDALPDRRKLFHASVFYADSGGMPGDGVF